MLKDNLLKYGILKCRDLVELYYGARMVASIREQSVQEVANLPFLLFGQDPRRISYEIILASQDAAIQSASLAVSPDQLNAGSPFYNLQPGQSIIIYRNFLTDLDAVTLPVWASVTTVTVTLTTRETFLTPAPVDEVPLG